MQLQFLLKSRFLSEHVSQTDPIEHVEHLDGHFVQVPLFSKNPIWQLQLLSKIFKEAPEMQLRHFDGLLESHLEHSFVSQAKHIDPNAEFK